MSAFAMAEDHILATEVKQHRGAYLAGEGAVVCRVHVLSAELDLSISQEFSDQREIGKRGTKDHRYALFMTEPLDDSIRLIARLRLSSYASSNWLRLFCDGRWSPLHNTREYGFRYGRRKHLRGVAFELQRVLPEPRRAVARSAMVESLLSSPGVCRRTIPDT